MSVASGKLLKSAQKLKDEDYTGENRCLPCTAVNLFFAAIFGMLAWVAISSVSSSPLGFRAGVFLFVLSCLIIYFRGYLVPGTPTLTKRYLPRWVLALFGKDPGITAVRLDDGSLDTLGSLRQGMILTDHDGEAVLTEEFERQLTERAADSSVEDAPSRLETALSAEHESVDVRPQSDGAVELHVGDHETRGWPTVDAVRIDVATATVLESTLPEWDALSSQERFTLLREVRSRLDTCPLCDGVLMIDGGFVESCCAMDLVSTLVCTDCTATLHEFQPDGGE